jgi:hypothetical protein
VTFTRRPGAPQDNRDVRRVQAAAARLRHKEAAARAAAAAAGPGKELKVNRTDLGSRVMPLKKGGFDQLCNAQAIACKKQVILLARKCGVSATVGSPPGGGSSQVASTRPTPKIKRG